MQLILFSGLQATGKSTFYQQRFFHSHVRISMDLLRTRNRERRLLQVCLETRMPCVVDNTNPTALERAAYIQPALKVGFEVVGYYFQSALAEVLVRNLQRPLERQVPERGIRGTRNRFEPPTRPEGFDRLYLVRPRGNLDFEVTDMPHGSGSPEPPIVPRLP